MIVSNKTYYNLCKYCDNQLPLDNNRWRIIDRIILTDGPIMIRVLSLKDSSHRVFILTRKMSDVIGDSGDDIDQSVILASTACIAKQLNEYINDQNNAGFSYGITGETALAAHIHVLAFTLHLYGASFGSLKGWDIIFSREYNEFLHNQLPERVDKLGFPVSGFDVLSKDMKSSFGIAGHYYNYKIPITKIFFGDKRIVLLTMVNVITFYAVALVLKFFGLDDLLFYQICKSSAFMPSVVENLCRLSQSGKVEQWVPIFMVFTFIWTLVASPIIVYYLSQNKTAVPYYQTRTQFNNTAKIITGFTIILILWLCSFGGNAYPDNVEDGKFILFYGSIITVPMVWAGLSYMTSGAVYFCFKIIDIKRHNR